MHSTVATHGLIPVEYVDGYEIGVGVSTLDGSARGSALAWENPVAAPPTGFTTDAFFNLVTTQKDLYRALGVSTEAAASYGLASASMKMSYADEFTSTAFSSWVVIRVTVSRTVSTFTPSNNVRLKPEALATLGSENGAAQFFQAYGDRFVYALQAGSEFLAVMQIDSTSQEEKQKLQSSWSAQGGSGKFSASASGTIDRTVNQSATTKQTSFQCRIIGPLGLPPDLDTTNAVVKFALAFPSTVTDQTSVRIKTFLQDYHSLGLPPGTKLSWSALEKAKTVLSTTNGYLRTLENQLKIAQDIASNAERYGFDRAPHVREKYTDMATQIQTDIASLQDIAQACATSFETDDTPTVPSDPPLPEHVKSPVTPPGKMVDHYHIKDRNSGQLIGVASASVDQGANLIQWPANGSPDQDWILEPAGTEGYYHIKNRHSGQLIGVAGASVDRGINLIQWPANGSPDQDWILEPAAIEGYYHIKDRNSGQVIAVSSGSVDPGANLIQWPAHGGPDQDWILEPAYTP